MTMQKYLGHTNSDPSTVLPVELIGHIFVLCLPNQHSLQVFSRAEDGWDKAYNYPVPFVLANVCSQWRRIALATPRLWNIVSINLGSTQSSVRHVHDLPQWLSRSGQLPLYIRLFNQLGGYPSILHTIIEHINKCSHRWRVLELRHLPESLIEQCRGNENASSVSLARLLLYPVHGPGDSDNRHTTSNAVFRMTGLQPQPQHLLINKVRFENLNIGWKRLTHLDATTIDLVEIASILQHAPNLARCTLEDIQCHNVLVANQPPPYTHRNISYLDVLNPPLYLLECFTFPFLTQFHIAASQTRMRFIRTFLDRCNAAYTLQWLTISNSANFSGETEELFQLLRMTTALTRLSLVELPLGNPFFEMFSNHSEGDAFDAFLLRLQHLRLKGIRDFRWTSIPPLFESEAVGRPLRKVEFELIKGRIDEPILRKIQLARCRGLIVRVTSPSGRDVIEKSQRYHMYNSAALAKG